MRRLFAQFVVIIFTCSILAGCPSREGAIPVEDPEAFFPERLSLGLPVFADIVKPIYGDTIIDTTDRTSLLSYDPDQAVLEGSNPGIIFSSKSEMFLSLNTEDDDLGRSEVSVIVGDVFVGDLGSLVNDDSVYKVDHTTGEIRLLNHFVHQVCEVIPAEIVQTVSTNAGSSVRHTVLHGDWVYVLTVEGNDCFDTTGIKRFYRLPLNYQFNSDETDETTTNELTIVSESLARAQLIFGWVDDDVTADPNDARLSYGFLGFGLAEQSLRFFDADRKEVWSQSRVLQTFPVIGMEGGRKQSPEYLAALTELDQYQYMIQLGLDVFVFDSTSEIFAKSFDETDTILTNRTFKMEAVRTESGIETVQEVKAISDSSDVVFVNANKIYRYDYASSVASPFSTRIFSVKSQLAPDVESEHESARFFSQFDLSECADGSEGDECRAAHNPELDSWQFITDCTEVLGCRFDEDTTDYCATSAELLVNPDAGELCTAADYRHLGELNDPADDADFRGFMQYAENYIRDLDFLLERGSLFITARMKEKDVLLRYFYNIDLTEPKPDRESVIFGARVSHFGLEAYISENNLFATSLWPKNIRSNECYKNHQQVTCNLGELEENDPSTSCSGKDLLEGLCFNEFIEYESLALFCSVAQVDAGECTDDQLISTNSLSVEGLTEDAKWLPLRDLASPSPEVASMYLLIGEDADVIDEGVLISPQLLPVNDVLGTIIPNESLGTLELKKVESVVDGWIADATFGRFDVIADDVIQQGGGGIARSLASVYFLSDPKSGAGTATKAVDVNILRPRIE